MGQGDSKAKKKPKQVVASGSGTNSHIVGSEQAVSRNDGPLVNEGDWVTSIPDEKTWLEYKHEPTDRTFAHVQVVKAVVVVGARVKTESDVFFMQSDKWVFHWHFTRDILRDPNSQDLGAFNALNYSAGDARDFVCITVTRYLDQNEYSFELAARDPWPLEKLVQTYETIKEKLYFGESLKYRPLSKLHESIVSHQTLLPVISSDHLFSGTQYQPLTIGTTFGFLRLVREDHLEADTDLAKWNDILLCESLPNDLPVISGLITSVLQTPLCHVALLCGNRGTPNIAAVGASQTLLHLVNKPVKLTVRVSEYTIEEVPEEEVHKFQQKAFEKLRKGANIKLEFDTSIDGIIRFKDLFTLKDEKVAAKKKCMGAKAINCYELARQEIGSKLLHDSFVIPYFYYHDAIDRIFVQETSVHLGPIDTESLDISTTLKSSPKEIMDSLISDSNANHSPDSKDYALKCSAIRQLIKSYNWQDPVGNRKKKDDSETHGLMRLIMREIENWKDSGVWDRCDGIIFRSSTNAEDIEGFNAAGLYESISVLKPAPNSDLTSDSEFEKACLDAMKKVWASVWHYRGFEERRLFGLDSSQVKMAILCQPVFNSAQRCNGVAITAHPKRHDFPGQLINVQKEGYLVTDSCAGARAEQHIIWLYAHQPVPVIETLCLSSLMDGEALLNEEELYGMTKLFSELDARFGHNTPTTRSNIVQGSKKIKFCVDVEFLVMKDSGEVLILQCRPYKMVYEFDHQRNALPRPKIT